ncbi:hypothetical protein I4U23_017782 [Adineta vaga]|nr:hypothetical protein I4U23_017782 [Adineta vaga]
MTCHRYAWVKHKIEYIDIGVRLTDENSDQLIADLIAQERNILSAGHIPGVDLYHFQIRRKRSHRSKREINQLVEELKEDERVEYVTVGKELQREKRDYFPEDKMIDLFKKYQQKQQKTRAFYEYEKLGESSFKISFDDELFRKQWYLENEGQFKSPASHDMNVAPVWIAGYSGKNIVICIVDDGLDHPHPELVDRYRPDLSYDLNDLDDPNHDPLPRTYDNQNNHGTECAGTAAAKANNELCGVGVAYNADIAGIRILDGRITTLLEARALTLFAADTHIKSASWGPTDDGTKMEAPGVFANAALDYGVTHGRHGKGTLYIWASGNGGAHDDDCGADGYVSHHNVISISSINHLGETPYFIEKCPSTLAVAYTGGMHSHSGREHSFPVGVIASDVGGKCTSNFAGTSSAAPIAAGAFAILLEANPDLTYRDVMHIVTETARIPTLSEADDWIINGAGHHVSDKFGFGVLDVAQMVALAQNWTNVPPRDECYQEYTGGSVYHFRGNVQITIISPSGTASELLSYRKNDASDKGIQYFPFLTTHSWNEDPIGEWILRMETRSSQKGMSKKSATEQIDEGELKHFGIRIFGSYNTKDVEQEKRYAKRAFIPTKREIELIYNREFAARNSPNVIEKRYYQSLINEKRVKAEKASAAVVTNAPADDKSPSGIIHKVIGYIRTGIGYAHVAISYIRAIYDKIRDFFSSKKAT